MKKLLNITLVSAMVCCLSLAVTSCKDDDNNDSDNGDAGTELSDDKHSEEAISFLTSISQLCDVYELPDNWKTATYRPTVGTVVDATRPNVRTVYVASQEEAALKYLSMTTLDVDVEDADLTTWHHETLGTLTFRYVFDSSDGLLATVEVNSPRIPELVQIRYVANEAMPTNSNYFGGPAYYQLGDVVREKREGHSDLYWICVRPAHPKLKGDSHWISLSYDDTKVVNYKSKRYPNSTVIHDLPYSKEHMVNLNQLLHSIIDPNMLTVMMMSNKSLKKGLGGLGLYDFNYVKLLASGWDENGIWNLLPQPLTDKFKQFISDEQGFSIDYYVKGHTSWTKYLRMYKATLSSDDFFTNCTVSYNEFKDGDVDLAGLWRDGLLLVAQYKKADQLDKNYKGNVAFDPTRFETVYRFRDKNEEALGKDFGITPKDGHYQEFTYKSVSASGDSILLSGMVAWPKTMTADNILIGCHITITTNMGAPTLWDGSIKQETNLLLDHNKFKGGETGYNCLVVIPDYEGYGRSVTRIHPYLYQEATARQVTDGVMAAKRIFADNNGTLKDGYKTISVGYSQGGSVAMATHRYIEQHPDICNELNFAGSVCGDGPYSPMETVSEYIQSNKMHMPVVMPLVLLSYCEYDPGMKALHCTIEDFLTEEFLASGIVDMVKQKKYQTSEIHKMFRNYIKSREGFRTGDDGYWYIETNNVIKADCIEALRGGATDNAKYRALKEALERNSIWGQWSYSEGWNNEKPVILYHSVHDEVVPFANFTYAAKRLDRFAGYKQDGVFQSHTYVGYLFFLRHEIKLVKKLLNNQDINNRIEYI